MNIWTNVVSSFVKSCDIKEHSITQPKPTRAKTDTELFAICNRKRIITELADVDITKYDIMELLSVSEYAAGRYLIYLKEKKLITLVKKPSPGVAAVYRVIGNA